MPPGPTATLKVVAVAGLGILITETAVATTSTKRQEKIFVAASRLIKFSELNAVKLE
jgi:hypothetical protein